MYKSFDENYDDEASCFECFCCHTEFDEEYAIITVESVKFLEKKSKFVAVIAISCPACKELCFKYTPAMKIEKKLK